MDYSDQKAENRRRNVEEARAGARRLVSRPLRFWFDLYGECSLACRHCGFQVHGRSSDREVDEIVYERVVTEILPTAYVCNLGGTNYGEMTISKYFHRFVRDCADHGVRISLTTNGTCMSDDWFDDLLDNLVVIGFSMEGMGDRFEQIRGYRWKHFLANVEKVARGRETAGRDFRMEWRYCTHADSIHQLPEMIRVAGDVGVDRIAVMNLVPFVAEQKFKQLYYHRSLANRYFCEARLEAARRDIEIDIPPDFEVGSFDDASCDDSGPQTVSLSVNGASTAPVGADDSGTLELPACHLPWQACSINELGIVRPCCTYWRPMGDLSRQSFESIWNGRRYRSLRDNINRRSNPICFRCRRPRFDSDENLSAGQLAPSVKQLLRARLSGMRSRPGISYTGTVAHDYDPVVHH
ncbi:MAG: hypothetical protein CMJ18_24835 [Phycisphaeraceae bacterium]|nr:hypothetical protein [Phycisphaeraceae bacterium]